MIISTTGSIDGKPVREYKGIVFGETIIGIKVDYETLGAGNGMMMVVSSGTAVVI